MNRIWILFLAFTILPPVVASAAANSQTPSEAGNKEDNETLRINDNRSCTVPVRRHYVARHRGIGFEILDSESEACFVPDQEYRLLDDLIDSVLARTSYDTTIQAPEAQRQQAAAISKTISDVLENYHFQIFIDTETLSDALIDRVDSNGSRVRIFDCDTGSLIFLTIAENLHVSVAMVEIPLAGNNDHNYVRWLSNGESYFEWDLNRRSARSTPSGLPWPYGKSMTRDEALAYSLSLRPKLWERRGRYDDAVHDYQTALMLYGGATGYNNFSWLIATRTVAGRMQLQKAALFAAEKAMGIYPKPNHRDTLACAYALMGDFERAFEEEGKAAEEQPDEVFKARKAGFKMKPPRDCTGYK